MTMPPDSKRRDFLGLGGPADAGGRSELQERLENRIALFELADQCGVPHRRLQVFRQDETHLLRRFLDQHRGANWESPLWLTTEVASSGFDRWSPPRERGVRDRELALLELATGHGFLVEATLEGARRYRLAWRLLSAGAFEFALPWDVSLSEGSCALGPVPWRTHFAVCPPSNQLADITPELERLSLQILTEVGATGEGTFDFWVEGGRTFLADAWSGPLADSPLPYEFELAETWSFAGFVWAMDELTAIPQPGVTRKCEVGEEDLPGWSWRKLPQPESHSDLGPLAVCIGRSSQFETGMEECGRLLRGLKIHGGLHAGSGYLKEILAHEWIRDGIFHIRLLEEDWISHKVPLSRTKLNSLISKVIDRDEFDTSRSYIVDGKRLSAPVGATFFSSDLSTVEPLGDECWRVSVGDLTRLVRKSTPGAPIGSGLRRELRAATSGKVEKRAESLMDWDGAHVCFVRSAGALLPHAVPREWTSRFRWLVTPGDWVLAGQLLGVTIDD